MSGARAISDAIEQIRQAGLLTADPVCYRVL